MSEVSTFRLYLLRAGYLYIAVGLAIFELPALLHPENLSRLDKVVLSMGIAEALGRGAHLLLALSEQADEQGLREALRNR